MVVLVSQNCTMIVGGSVKQHGSYEKIVRRFLKRLRIESPYDSTISLLNIYKIYISRISRSYLYIQVHYSTLYSSQGWKHPN
jgi:predicted nucleotidyltransferase